MHHNIHLGVPFLFALFALIAVALLIGDRK